ncbi:TPA: ROK family protein, partial [Streptococcus suis]|nr:ROK family protein [Streptococcus suis]
EISCSGPAIERQGKQMYGEDLSTKAVFDNWRKGDITASAIIANARDGMVQAIHNMICLLDPKIIVLGGSVAQNNPDFIEDIKTVLGLSLHHEQKHILNNIIISKIDNGNNGIIGSAFLVQ